MIKKLLFILPVASALLVGCDTKEKSSLQSRVDSLSVELEASQKVAATMQEVGVLMDSIDASRQLLKVNMAEGTSYENYTDRMRELNNYIKESQAKVAALEEDLKNSKSSSSSISKQVSRMKKDRS